MDSVSPAKEARFLLKAQSPEDQVKWRLLNDQFVLAIFFHHANGHPLKAQEWSGVVKELYGVVWKQPATAMPPGAIKAV
jgi:hypothetical protein